MWAKPTLENLRANLSEIETQAFGQEDLDDAPLLQQLKDTVSSVRGFVRSGRKCRMPSDEELIPDFLISPAMDIAVFNLLKRHRVPANESRTKAYDRACALLEKVGVGQIVPEDYGENAAEVSPDNQTPLPAFRRRKRVLGRSQEEGL